MEPFTISTLMTKKEYGNFFYKELYRKPGTIIATLAGLCILLIAELEFAGSLNYNGTPWLDLGLGIFILLGPSLVVFVSVKRFASNPSYCDDISYTFGEDGIIMNAKTFDATLKWEHIIKIKQTKKFLLLFAAAKMAYFIKTDRLTNEQIEFIKSKVVTKK